MRVQRQNRRPSPLTVSLLVAVALFFAVTGSPGVEQGLIPPAGRTEAAPFFSPEKPPEKPPEKRTATLPSRAFNPGSVSMPARRTGSRQPHPEEDRLADGQPDDTASPAGNFPADTAGKPAVPDVQPPAETVSDPEPVHQPEQEPACPPELEFQPLPENEPEHSSFPEPLYVIATFYGDGDGLDGQPTAAGEIFNANDFTAAHRTLPFGTRVRVTYLKTGRAVEVRINDRGPFNHNLEIDLSAAAAREIGLFADGVGRVELIVLTGDR